MAFALHLLAKHPEIQERAYSEIMNEIGDLVISIFCLFFISCAIVTDFRYGY